MLQGQTEHNLKLHWHRLVFLYIHVTDQTGHDLKLQVWLCNKDIGSLPCNMDIDIVYNVADVNM
jgi:hypothetical protein